MGNPIVKLGGKYLVWSTIVDAPVSYGMTLAELETYVREEDGRRGVDELGRRLQRVAEKGTSSFDDKDADDTIWLNRAGPDETPLHREEIIEFYVRKRTGRPTEKALAAFRKGLPRCGPKCPSILDKDGCGGFCRKCWGTDHVRALRVQGPADET
jgi:hypothetical protein